MAKSTSGEKAETVSGRARTNTLRAGRVAIVTGPGADSTARWREAWRTPASG
jgi:hypothetical protein